MLNRFFSSEPMAAPEARLRGARSRRAARALAVAAGVQRGQNARVVRTRGFMGFFAVQKTISGELKWARQLCSRAMKRYFLPMVIAATPG